ncbi:hypothetical protein V0R52_22430 [Pseudomonas asiatica]|nr:hypothetical protein [Pseudomonas asiatica]
MSDDAAKPVDPLASIRHLLPDLPADESWLGEDFRGWQRFANAMKIASEEYDYPMIAQPGGGYLRIDYPFAPPHLGVLAYAIEMATDQICQLCSRHPATAVSHNGRTWKLCARCAMARTLGVKKR